MCKAGLAEEKAKLRQGAASTTRSATARAWRKELQYAALPDAIHTAAQAKVDGLTCNGAPIASS